MVFNSLAALCPLGPFLCRTVGLYPGRSYKKEAIFMSNNQKSTALYPHPFSKAYWHDAAAELKDTHMLVFAALMIALRLVMKQVSIPITPFLRINAAYFVNALGAMVFGPVFAALCAAVTDVLGYIIRPDGVYFPPFILTEIGGSVVFALFLYRAKVTTTRVMLSRFSINLFINVLLQTPIMMWYYALYMNGKQYTFAMAVPGMIKNVLMFPIESVLLTLFLGVMLPITNRLGLTYSVGHAKDALKFSKKQVLTLALLFVFGVGCVFGYLGYYYTNTSLSASYTTEERYRENTHMTQVLAQENTDIDPDSTVTTIESAYKKFLTDETTYTVAVYTVNEEALSGYDKDLETIRGMSKSKAKAVAEDGVMEKVGTATIVLNTKTDEVLSFSMK